MPRPRVLQLTVIALFLSILVTPGKRVKSGELWAGTPARLMRAVTAEEMHYIETLPERRLTMPILAWGRLAPALIIPAKVH